MNRRIRKRRKKGLASLPINTSISIGCAVVNLIVICILTIKATVSNGHAGIIMGLVGLLSIAIGGFGIFYAVKGFRDDDNNYVTAPLIAVIVNGLLTIFFIILYVIGIFV